MPTNKCHVTSLSCQSNETLEPTVSSLSILVIGFHSLKILAPVIDAIVEGDIPCLLIRVLSGARVEIGLAAMAYNLKRMVSVLGAIKVTQALHHA